MERVRTVPTPEHVKNSAVLLCPVCGCDRLKMLKHAPFQDYRLTVEFYCAVCKKKILRQLLLESYQDQTFISWIS